MKQHHKEVIMAKHQSLPVLSIHRARQLDLIASQDRVVRAKKPTARHPMIISASELRDFLRCRTKWAWRHHHRIVPIQPRNTNLDLGGLVHEILAEWYDSKRSVKTMAKIAKAHVKRTDPSVLPIEDLELVWSMCVGYAEWAKEHDAELSMKNIQTERWFELPLLADRSILVRGKIDVTFEPSVYKRTIGSLEHKTKGQIKMEVIDLNLQLSVYLWALRHLEPKYKRYIAYYNVLRKQMPGPRVTAPLFAREGIERQPDEIDQWVQDTRRVAYDMLDAAIYPNPMDSCSWECDYQNACMMRGRPDDLRHVLTSEFVNKDGTELIYGEE